VRSGDEEALLDAVAGLGPALLRVLAGFEQVLRHLHPPALGSLRASLAEIEPPFAAAREAFAGAPVPEPLADFAAQLTRASDHAQAALRGFLDPAPGREATLRVLGSMREHARAQAALYPLRGVLPPVNRYFFEPAVWDRIAELDPPPSPGRRVGLHHWRDASDERGGFTFFVPESYAGDPLPLVVALHGGAGHGADFLWSWLREARSRRFLLLAPTSQGSTWSLMGPDVDAAPLDAVIAFVRERWAVDGERILVTGLSDGATYSLLYGLRAESPASALAPISGVLHPANFANGNLARARGRRIYLVHGALDWMFPIALARAAAEELARAGADLEFREIADLSHTYPREENARILAWLEPGLALSATPPDA
jgi:phospholipase/carboxylesterase